MQDDNRTDSPSAERILPSTDRLLRGVQATLQKMATLVGDEQSRWELASIDIVLSEIARRQQTGFYAEYYCAVRELLREGMTLLRPALAPAAATEIDADLASALPASAPALAGFEVLMPLINRAQRHLATLVSSLHGPQPGPTEDFVRRVVARENGFHVHRMQFSQSRRWDPASGKPALTAERLQDYLRQREPGRKGLRVTSFKLLVGGFQKVTALFETEDDGGRKESLVLRLEKDDRFVALDAGDIRREYEIVKFLHQAGMPVAEPYWVEEDESRLGNRFMVSQRVPGQNFGSAVSATGFTDEIARSYVEAIARVHLLPRDEAMRRLPIGRWMNYATSAENTRAAMAYWRHQIFMKHANPSPLTERAFNWLVDNAPDGDIPQCLIHCDYGPHNTLVHEGRMSGILDWESARIGDPAEDLSWFLQSSGGQVDYGKAIAWYEEFTGHRIDMYRMRYYDVLGCLKIMVSSGSAEAMYEAHEEASITWLNLSYLFTTYGTSPLEDRIKLAESLKSR